MVVRMNGMQAMRCMEKGGTVYRIGEEGTICYRIKLGEVQTKTKEKWITTTVFNVLDWYEEYHEPKSIDWERVREGESYFTIDEEGLTYDSKDVFSKVDERRYEIANYFSTATKAMEVSFKQTLFRKLLRFSDENGAQEIDWSNDNQEKWYIMYDHYSEKLMVKSCYSMRQLGNVHFLSEKVAREAMKLFKDDLIKYFEEME